MTPREEGIGQLEAIAGRHRVVTRAAGVTLSAGWFSAPDHRPAPGILPVTLDANGLPGARNLAYKYMAADPYDPWRAHRARDPAFQDTADLLPGDGVWIRLRGGATWTLAGV